MANMETVRQPLPFRYPGGKHYAIDLLRPFWEAVPHDEYREPFAGGATVFFNKPPVKFNWLNDLDHELMIAYRIMSDPVQRAQLIGLVSAEVASKERWKEMFLFQPRTALEVAYKYFYLNRTSFSGKLVSPAWGYRPKRSLPPERWHERINPCGEKLENVTTTTGDFTEVISAPAREKSVLMYVDPPYFAPPKKKHYRNGFELEDHQRLSNRLRETNHKFFLTYDDVDEVRQLYHWAYIYQAKFFYRVDNSNVQNGSRRIGFELIITNFEKKDWIAEQRELQFECGARLSVSA